MESKGEKKIRELLEKRHMPFLQEYSFSDLKSVRNKSLRFDFAVFSEDGKLQFLIEYQGEQHYLFIPYFSKDKLKWAAARENDVRKCRYCLMHNIPLYCIPYYEYDNIQTIEDLCQDKYRVKSKWHNQITKID